MKTHLIVSCSQNKLLRIVLEMVCFLTTFFNCFHLKIILKNNCKHMEMIKNIVLYMLENSSLYLLLSFSWIEYDVRERL